MSPFCRGRPGRLHRQHTQGTDQGFEELLELFHGHLIQETEPPFLACRCASILRDTDNADRPMDIGGRPINPATVNDLLSGACRRFFEKCPYLSSGRANLVPGRTSLRCGYRNWHANEGFSREMPQLRGCTWRRSPHWSATCLSPHPGSLLSASEILSRPSLEQFGRPAGA